MKERYPYRFKTREEFVKTYGSAFYMTVCWNSEGLMDYLFGTEYPFYVDFGTIYLPHVDNNNINRYGFEYWTINWNMLTKNKITVPNYKSKKVERVL